VIKTTVREYINHPLKLDGTKFLKRKHHTQVVRKFLALYRTTSFITVFFTEAATRPSPEPDEDNESMKTQLPGCHSEISLRTYDGKRNVCCGASIHLFTAKRSHAVPYLEHNKERNSVKCTLSALLYSLK
jgi:hypothetical protein